ncbi:MAG: dTMP kinase [Pseudomonadota bacterium]
MAGKGLFVSLEGIDGSGKSTQMRLLSSALAKHGDMVVSTREPGGAPGAEIIRALLVEGATDRWSPETEILLFTAARRDHVERTIQPALDAGKVVLTDRFADSTRVYQGATRGDLRQLVDDIHDRVISLEPDLTLILDMDPETALQRGLARASGEDRFEAFGVTFQRKLRAGFQALAAQFPDRCKIVDAARDEADIAAELRDHVLARLP